MSPDGRADAVPITFDRRNSGDVCIFQEDFLPKVMPPVLILEFVFGLLGNLFTIWITWWHIKVWSGFTVYLFNLAIADLLFVFQLPMRIAYHLNFNDWHLGEFICDLMAVLFYTNMYGSIYFLTCISVERWQAIGKPLRSLRQSSVRRAKIISLAMWALAIIPQIGMPLIFNLTYNQSNTTKCLSFNQLGVMHTFRIWNTVEVFIGFLIPFLIMVVVQVKMARILLCQSTNPMLVRTRKRAACSIIVILVIFAFCFVPVHICRVLLVTVHIYFPDSCALNQMAMEGFYVSLLICSCNCFMDPLILFVSGSQFRGAARAAMKVFCSRAGIYCKDCTEKSKDMFVYTISMHDLELRPYINTA
ncbi:lysophosphatidic acid receptor 6-like [Lampetra fluviatilis]